MIDKVSLTIQKYAMLSPGDTVVAGISGGADSTALLLILNDLSKHMDFKIIAAHVNHCIRQEAADSDAIFVKELCDSLDIECKTLVVDVIERSKELKIGTEQCGRQVRYEFFESIEKGAKIATAHNMNDNTETVIFNLTRGTSVKGMGGIAPIRGDIIRPLIECERSEIESFLKERGQSWVEDLTNESDEYTRNHIRLNVIPELKKINPSLNLAVLRCSQGMRETDYLLTDLAEELLLEAKISENKYDCKVLLSYHPTVTKCAITSILNESSFEQTQRVYSLLQNGGKINVSSNLFVKSEDGVLTVGENSCTQGEWEIHLDLCEGSAFFEIPGGILKINIISLKDLKNIHTYILDNMIDCDKIKSTLFLGSRKSGDKIKTTRFPYHIKLKKLYNELKIPKNERNCICVIRSDDDVIWTEKTGTGSEFLIDENTKSAYYIEIDRNCEK